MIRIARQHGFEIRTATFGEARVSERSRTEPVGSTTASGCIWCEIRGQRVLFIDMTQTAAEQIVGIREIIETTSSVRPYSAAG
ncbi:MAG: hypothetical protein AAF670_15505 [Planctomycetota bacterium]